MTTRTPDWSVGSLLAAAGALLLVAGPLVAQEHTVVGSEPYCDCEIVFEHVVSMGDYDGPGALPGEIRQVNRGTGGNYYVVPYSDHRILRFTPSGEALSPLGSQGEGPGEVVRIVHLAMLADSFFVFDLGNARATVFDPDYRVVRTAPIDGQITDSGFLSDGTLVVNGRFGSPDVFGIPLHHIDQAGMRIGSFGGKGLVRVDASQLWRRRVATGANTVWAAHLNQYVIEEWSPEGELLRTIERPTDWFEPYLRRTWGGPDEPVPPRVQDIVLDDRGYLRTLVLRASPRWAELLPPPIERSVGGLVYPIPPGSGLLESLVEIIDPVTGQLFAAGLFEKEIYGFVDANHVFSYTEDERGIPQIHIWRLRLSRG
jgi:hypothetical protein